MSQHSNACLIHLAHKSMEIYDDVCSFHSLLGQLMIMQIMKNLFRIEGGKFLHSFAIA